MRITTQMLNRASERSGIPLQRNSLLNYVNQTGSSQASLLGALQSKTGRTSAADNRSRAKFEKQGKAADELKKQVQSFAAKSGEKTIFEECAETGDTAKFVGEAEKLTEKYNGLLSALGSSPDTLDAFYGQSMKDLVSSNRELLETVGITAAKDGKLQIDKEKLKGASVEELQKVFGEKSEFLAKLRFLSERVSDRADANLESASGNYSQSGNMNYYSPNKYNFRG